jgi:hypothetical protein
LTDKNKRVPRPAKKSEYEILFASNSAQKGWQDLRATRLNDLVEAWEFLTRNPTVISPLNSRLRGELGQVNVAGSSFDRWQLKLSSTYGARIWFYVDGKAVFIEEVHTRHPNETK